MHIPRYAPQWSEIELSWTIKQPPAEAYFAELSCRFEHDDGSLIERPAFWDGAGQWRVRFSSPKDTGQWQWSLQASALPELDGQTGHLQAQPSEATLPAWRQHGLLQMSANGRGVVHADGQPFFVCADTAWALPFRATREQVAHYAEIRAAQGFNATLLMSVQPDKIRPTEARPNGWDEGFGDLANNRLRENVPSYFQYLDGLIDELLAHGIVPVWQPIFHGYGWRGGPTAGPTLPPAEVAWYARYLVARYGARPALWLACGDGFGIEPTVAAAGEAFEQFDAYQQPTGLHYAPHASDQAHSTASWADFHWCQTGHSGEHQPEKVAWMWDRLPQKGIANGEPSYEEMGQRGRAAGWWQGEEAWRNLCAGGTMAVVYGAGSLWQWRQSLAEPDQPWTMAEGCTWQDALKFPGGGHVGRVQQLLAGLPIHQASPNRSASLGRPGLLLPNEFYISYLQNGGETMIVDEQVPLAWTAYNAQTGAILAQGKRGASSPMIGSPQQLPTVIICKA
ncbi:DUF4038 domain-containing protein [Coraliomargarita sp. SDUM461003]|uniref:DUF4038 domain-containing protein n=1 Tax=Thalassobacterium maritimum TaxID=3041265 RepID=A0ABU1AXM0_9BACT|nr:DUF4038 domain-containing protein [Coraliomargarita sp. SDUM461003]MDQ8208906.1 DUF4038 domain-containing protein [Coraliomargarita sp. SDUM461003]